MEGIISKLLLLSFVLMGVRLLENFIDPYIGFALYHAFMWSFFFLGSLLVPETILYVVVGFVVEIVWRIIKRFSSLFGKSE